MPPGAWALFAVFALAALQGAVTLLVQGRGGSGETVFSTPEADATHLVMNGVMAVMVTPAYTPTIRFAASLVLAVSALGVALALFRHWPGARPAGPLSFRAYAIGAAYHVLMLGAMIYALSAMGPAMGAMCRAGLGAMTAMNHAPRRGFDLARLFAILFAVDAVTGAVAVMAFPRQLLAAETTGGDASDAGVGQSVRDLARQARRLRIGFIPHLVMDAGMVWMLGVG